MVKWVHFVTFIGVAIVISCEAKSPKRRIPEDSKRDHNEGGCDKTPTCGANEVYDICPRLCPPRRCDVDERIIRCGENPKPGDPKCEPGCRCVDNYYRNNDGFCVTRDECPKCFLKNEVYACQSSDPQTCETIDEDYGTVKKTKHCKRECRCKKGYYRNKIGECISKENCLKCNGPHEYFTCGSACDNVCDTIHFQNQTNCPIKNVDCNPMCYCEYGYARDHNNICVPIAECPPKCDRPNEVSQCQNICPQTCETIGEICLSPHVAKRDCKRECRCKKGFYRNKLGDCISEENCLKCTGPNEYFSCGRACDNVCATLSSQNQTHCPIVNIVCNPMCYCEEGYARDENKICVPITDCPFTCGVNEVYDICPRLCPPRKCGVDERLFSCPRNPEPGDPNCKPGCRCADNYYRNNDGLCVPKNKCPKCTRKNEVYACHSSNPQTCESIDEDYRPVKRSKHCKRECRCKAGYYKNKIGECISKENCLKCNGPNEYFTCGSACDNVCATLHLQNQTSCPIKNKVCNEKCYCEEGYARDENNICVPFAECLPVCDINEVYDICPSFCPPRRCDVDERLIKCRPYPLPGNPECQPGCRCADNFYRNDLGFCVTRDECPPLVKCGENEYPSRCANGGCKKESCAFPEVVCAKLVDGACEEGCLCKENYLRADNGTCIPEDQCPPVCGINEVYDICPPVCPPQRCGVDIPAIPCIPNPIPGDPNCNPGCRCADNYVRNDAGICIPKNECPPEPTCGDNEEPSDCANGGCRRWKCSDEGTICNNLLDDSCVKGCVCKESYTRADDGRCIPEDQCPSICEINEVYDVCPPACPPQRCGVNIATILCVPNPMPGDPDCNPGCRCADDYVRNDAGICIPKNECPPEPTCGDNEEPSDCANGGCRRWKCSDEGTICNDLLDDPCVKGCVCKDSYTRADDGRCIPEDQCLSDCGFNEVYDICPPVCPPLKCGVNIAAISCKPSPKPGDPECNPGCRCADNYVRNDAGICIPRDECPPEPICGNNEELSDCANGGCRQWKCSDEGIICKDFTEESCIKGCVCIDSYVRDDNGNCIPEDQCPGPIQCGLNEQYSACANGGCRRFTCANNGILCIDLIEGGCNPGCVCIESYTRADNGTCIPEDECPSTCEENEVYDICPALCPPKTCDVDERTIDCAPNPLPGDPECNPGCRCADNYYRNNLGVCVTREQCPPLIECGTNEIASRCANGGCRKLSCAIPQVVCAKIPIGSCEEGCICKENYLRASNGTCVLESECPPVCGLNEVYDECPPTCPPQRCDVDNRLIKCKRTPTPGDPGCKPGCRCEDNYYRNNLEVCVTREECPPLIQCGENEHPSKCANGGCRKVSCARPQIRCVKLQEGGCKEGCLCNDKYLRAENGTCIPEGECPPVCGINEVYDICPPICPQQRCDVNIALILCKPNPKPGDPECNPGCRCADNYVKNNEGICVPRDECPKEPKCGENEELSDCANGGCRRWKCSDEVAICKDLKTGSCQKGCICKESYVRADDGTCIPENQCPPLPIDCGLNEEYSTCANGGCRRYNCNMSAILCIDLREGACKPGCICKETYTRADDGSCIPEDQCPKRCGPNEEYGCDNTCTKTCNIIDGKCVPPVKSKICKLQCHCKEGYKRNRKGKCVKECDGVTEKTTDGLTAFEEGNIDFTEQFLITASKNNPGESVIGSPFSVLFLLAQLALYATGQAKTQLLNLLHLNNDCEIRTSVPKYIKLISETNNASFDLAQKIYGNDKYPFSQNFKEDSRIVFNAEAQNVNFAKPQEAADIINKWVEKQTHNLINNLVSPDSLSANTRLVLAIAIYFKGDWKHQFKPRHTKPLPFYTGRTTGDEVEVQMMNQVGNFKYAEIDGVQVLEMPYKVPDISFVVCLTKSKTGVKKLIKKLKKTSFIKRTLTELKSTAVDVSIPRLDISTTIDLKKVLSDAGVDAIFEPATAGLSGILENPEDIFVTTAIQKAIIRLNETGTEAAAATAVVVGVRSRPIVPLDPVIFNADHPFIYYIVLKKTLVFAGVYAGPQ